MIWNLHSRGQSKAFSLGTMIVQAWNLPPPHHHPHLLRKTIIHIGFVSSEKFEVTGTDIHPTSCRNIWEESFNGSKADEAWRCQCVKLEQKIPMSNDRALLRYIDDYHYFKPSVGIPHCVIYPTATAQYSNQALSTNWDLVFPLTSSRYLVFSNAAIMWKQLKRKPVLDLPLQCLWAKWSIPSQPGS